jgi:4-diphosphocytidyl-2-C-methyl-D-erythritol kinase
VIERAPAKLNLCLYVGPVRADGLHEIRSLFCPISLADHLRIDPSESDEVVCPGIVGEDLAGRALTMLRDRGWRGPPVRVEVDKRIPVAAGLGGGSADAAAVLRLARGELDGLEALAAELGADVPSQLDPAFALVGGAGEEVEPLPPPPAFGVVLVPVERGLATADVYAEADAMGLGRTAGELDEVAAKLRDAATGGASPLDYADLLVNDLEPAARALAPEVADAIAALEDAGARHAMVTGSGPTAFGIFEDVAIADRAAAALPHRFAGAIVAAPDRFR